MLFQNSKEDQKTKCFKIIYDMDNQIKNLSKKLDKILEQQELILYKLKNQIPYESYQTRLDQNISSKQKKDQEMDDSIKKQINIQLKYGPHQRRLQNQFNLTVLPHFKRVKMYMETKDPKVFDGLKRNNSFG